jgi:hypothetical protein
VRYFVHGVDRENIDEQLEGLAESRRAYMDEMAATVLPRIPGAECPRIGGFRSPARRILGFAVDPAGGVQGSRRRGSLDRAPASDVQGPDHRPGRRAASARSSHDPTAPRGQRRRHRSGRTCPGTGGPCGRDDRPPPRRRRGRSANGPARRRTPRCPPHRPRRSGHAWPPTATTARSQPRSWGTTRGRARDRPAACVLGACTQLVDGSLAGHSTRSVRRWVRPPRAGSPLVTVSRRQPTCPAYASTTAATATRGPVFASATGWHDVKVIGQRLGYDGRDHPRHLRPRPDGRRPDRGPHPGERHPLSDRAVKPAAEREGSASSRLAATRSGIGGSTPSARSLT